MKFFSHSHVQKNTKALLYSFSLKFCDNKNAQNPARTPKFSKRVWTSLPMEAGVRGRANINFLHKPRKSQCVSGGSAILPPNSAGSNAGNSADPQLHPRVATASRRGSGYARATCIFCASKFSQNPLYGLAQSLTPGVRAGFCAFLLSQNLQ